MTEGLPELIAETLPKFFDGDSGTHQQWLQCRHCRGYAESEKGHRPTVTHHSWCPVGLLEKAYAALREASRPQEAAPKKDVMDSLHQVFTRNGIASYTDCPHLAGDVIRWACEMYRQSGVEASRLASPPATTAPILLNAAQTDAVALWAADDRLWTTEDTVQFNLLTFARLILSLSASRPAPTEPKGVYLNSVQLEQVMNALEGWDGKDAIADEAHRKAAFEMIQEVCEPLAASPPEAAPAPTFNLNEYVWVKVLDRGFVILADNDDALNMKLRTVRNAPLFNRANAVFKEQEQNDGWSKWQLWSLFQTFGAHISLGCSPPFETEIRLAAHGSRPTTETSIRAILDGIDKEDGEGGWWETSKGKAFGAMKLRAILDAIKKGA